MNFYDYLEKQATVKKTENGATTYSSSLSKNLDFFALGGAIRKWDSEDIQKLFAEAYYEDKETALRNLAHLRNIRDGGLGERKAFRESLKFLAESKKNRNMLLKLVDYMPVLGRWDDVIYLFDITKDLKLKKAIAQKIRQQFESDMEKVRHGSGQVSLLAKWMPSVNTSSKHTRQVARDLIKYMWGKHSPSFERNYRKQLAAIRDYLNVIEVRLSAKEYDKINYSHVPSIASIKYRTAFYRNDAKRYQEYLDRLTEGRAKVNASVTYPYQIVEAYMKERGGENTLLEEAWKALPDYIGDNDERAIVVADTSGSMTGTPMNVAISLAIYCAQRLQGAFRGRYISFSETPTLNVVYDTASLYRNIEHVYRTDWGMNTDINRVFQLILQTAVRNNVRPEDMPNKIIIISD